ncbi:MAG: hypothetical protein ABIF10_02355, partial [Candidatus Woesearchaeota archaeon]
MIQLLDVIGPQDYGEYLNTQKELQQIECSGNSLLDTLLSEESIAKSDTFCRKLRQRITQQTAKFPDSKWQIKIRDNDEPLDSKLVQIFEESKGKDWIEPRIFNASSYKSKWDLMLNMVMGGAEGEEKYSNARRDAFWALPGTNKITFAIIIGTDIYKENPQEHLSEAKIRQNGMNDLAVLTFSFQRMRLIEKLQEQKDRADQYREALLRESQKDVSWKMIQNICHEFRNPSVAVNGFVRRIRNTTSREK